MAYFNIEFYSQALIRPVSFKMFIPNDPRGDIPHTESRKMKTLFLLHGYTGAAYYWGHEQLAERYNFAMVMPSGENGFFLDGPATGYRYCTFIGEELVDYIRRTFGLAMSADETYICGLSMGGFGALHTAFAYPQNFGKVGAMSSALIVHDIAKLQPGDDTGVANYDYYRQCFGDLENVEQSDANPETLVCKLLAAGKAIPEIYLCCGTEDFLLGKNREFHQFLAERNVPHLYKESTGIHDGRFWDEYTPKIMEWMFGE